MRFHADRRRSGVTFGLLAGFAVAIFAFALLGALLHAAVPVAIGGGLVLGILGAIRSRAIAGASRRQIARDRQPD